MIVVVGTKGMLIKTLGILKELDSRKIYYYFINLGQHGERMNEISKQFELSNYDVNMSKKNDIGSMMEAIKWFLKLILINKTYMKKSRIMIVQGDTPATLLGFILAKLWGIKVAHVEAGFRSFDLLNPFPEEIIRRIVDRGSDYLFPPSDDTNDNLVREGVSGKIIKTKYNTVLDAIKIAYSRKPKFDMNNENYVLVSIHRVENIYSTKRMKLLIDIINNIKLKIIWPIHESTKLSLIKNNYMGEIFDVQFMNLQDYVTFIHLIKNARFIITDGGGPQEESYYLGTPCLLYRKTTEHIEGIGANVILSKYDINTINSFLSSYEEYRIDSFFDDVSPSKIIVDKLLPII